MYDDADGETQYTTTELRRASGTDNIRYLELPANELTWSYDASTWNPDEAPEGSIGWCVNSLNVVTQATNGLFVWRSAEVSGTIPRTHKDIYDPKGYRISWLNTQQSKSREVSFEMYLDAPVMTGNETSELTIRYGLAAPNEPLEIRIRITGVAAVETILPY